MTNTWFTSDTHYNHKNIIDYCNRPYSSAEEMNESIIDNYNKIVKNNDNVYFLGDFAFGKKEEIFNVLKRLNGNKHLILGNHDKNIENNIEYFIGNIGFCSIQYYKEISIMDQKICLFHYACRTFNKAHHGSWHLFGHSHGSLEPNGRSVDVGVDSHWVNGKKYFPFEFEQIAAFMKNQKFEKIDHHEE